MQVCTLLAVLLFGTACNGQVKKDLPKEKEHPKLIKNLGNGNVQCGLQDKAGNLWFGTSDNGLSRYDGKSFTCFKDELINPWIWAILEDKTGNLWMGTRETGLYLFDGKIFINYSEYKQ